MKTKEKIKPRAEFEFMMKEWIEELYSQFLESKEKRKEVFHTFDKAIEEFRDKARIKAYFEKLKKVFQSLKVTN